MKISENNMERFVGCGECKPIRVLNLFTNMNYGGAETMVMNYYRNIDRSKVQFDFMVHRKHRGAYDDEIEALGGKIYRMIPIYPQNFHRYKKMLSNFFDEHKEYSIIHSHMSELGYFVFKEARKRNIPIIICHAHNTPVGFDFKMLFRNFFKFKNLKNITHMFMCSKESAEWLYGKKYQDRFIMMNNAIDVNKFKFSESIRNINRKELNIEDKLVIGHVGRFDKQKNHPFLIEIFNEIYKLRNDAVLVLVGDDKNADEIHKKVHDLGLDDVVYFLGSRSDVNEILQGMDAFIFPSIFEGFGIAPLEAQTAGLPCFVSNAVPNECLITDNIFPVSLEKSALEWAKIILDKTKNFERKDTSQIIIDKGFDIKTNAKWLEDFYLNAIADINEDNYEQ